MPKILPSPERVLPTLNADGSRRWIRPRPFRGRFERARKRVALGLMLLFAGVPFLRVGGKPAILLDVAAREFTLLGATFLATDGALLMLLMLTIFVGIFLVTAVLGRAWCGWACPQTVYMEFLFRPLERLIEGGRREQQRLDRQGPNLRRVLKHVAFALLSVALANVFLAYFVGTERLALWMTSSPLEHPTGFAVLSVTASLIFADFAFFREQMCTVTCPYARLQSVLLDPRSLVVGYDSRRGEPRGRGKDKGDCVDCGACVVTCPTGIDIRNGLQLECITCAQCIDACDSVMHKLGRKPGLIRYDSQHALHGTQGSLRPSRPRLYVYPALLVTLVGALLFFGRGASEPDVTVLRGIGAPFEVQGARVQNQVRIKIQNRGDADASYGLRLEGVEGAELVAPENPLPVAAGQRRTTSVFVLLPVTALPAGQLAVRFVVTDGHGLELSVPYKLLGPQPEAS